MKTIFNKLLLVTEKVRNFIPSRLPTGVTEFMSWSDSIIRVYGKDFGLPDDDSVRWALAVQIMHLGPTESHKSKRFFAKMLHKGCATQVAHGVMTDLKAKQELKAKQAAATASIQVPDGQILP